MSARATRLALAAAGIAMLLWCGTQLRVGTDVTRFLPEAEDVAVAALSRRLSDSDLTRTMVLCVDAGDPARSREAALALAARWAEIPDVADVRTGVDPDQLREIYEIYFPRRHHFLSPQPETLADGLLSDAGLAERAAALRRELLQPTSTLLDQVAGADPLGAFGAIIERFRRSETAVRMVEGQFMSADGAWAVVFLRTSVSGFESGAQRRVLAGIEAARAQVEAGLGPLRLEQSGVNRFAVDAEQRMQGDVVLIAACSFFGVAAVFLAFFRSPRFFLLCMTPPVLGFGFATSAGLLARGDVDGLTLAFGVTLIGVALDYSIHLINHQRLVGSTPRTTARHLRAPLTLGALTTMASFAGLLLTSFPALRELGAFSIAGVGAALLVTLFGLPDLLPRERPVPALSQRMARGLGVAVEALARRRGLLAAIPVLVLLLAPFLLPRIQWIDDLSQLVSIDPAIGEEDRRVRERVAQLDGSRFVIATGDDVEGALRASEAVHARLVGLQAAGAFDGMRSLHALLWSRDLQRRNLAAVAAAPDLGRRLDRAFQGQGFRADAFQEFEQFLAADPASPLGPEDLHGTGLETLLRALLLDLGDRAAAVTYLRGVRDDQAVAAALEDVEGAWLFDQNAFADGMYSAFREATLRQILIGSLLVGLVLLLRYRAWRPALAAFFPSLLVALALLELFAVFGVQTNLLHVVCLIMVMGMGVDYGIFLVDAARDARVLEATLLSLLLSCLTTLCVFGSLAISGQPALRAIGVTTGGGILLSFLLAPLTFVVLGRPASRDDAARV